MKEWHRSVNGTDLRVPVGEGKGELKLLSGSGMLMRSGGSGARTVLFIMTGGSASSTIDWNIRRMFVLGNRNVHLTTYKYITTLNKIVLLSGILSLYDYVTYSKSCIKTFYYV